MPSNLHVRFYGWHPIVPVFHGKCAVPKTISIAYTRDISLLSTLTSDKSWQERCHAVAGLLLNRQSTLEDAIINQNMKARRWISLSLISIGMLLLVLEIALIEIPSHMGPFIRNRIIEVFKAHFETTIEIADVRISIFPRISLTGRELVLRQKGRTDIPPLIAIRKCMIECGLFGFLSHPMRIRLVRLEGLQVTIPPKRPEDGNTRKRPVPQKHEIPDFMIDQVLANGTVLRILPKNFDKDPIEFDITKLMLHSSGPNLPMRFQATLTNPKPPGLIQSTGDFGPWQRDDPGSTPVSGSYTFKEADLSVFKGIAGILFSTGSYRGLLNHIEVDGTTNTPNFALEISDHPMLLKTQFHAIVDGTTGDTLLKPVNAQFGRCSTIAQGGVVGTRGIKGKTISLDLSMIDSRIEDMLLLTVKSDTPLMTGTVNFKAKFELPPGDGDLIERLNLRGDFGIGAAKFMIGSVQQRVESFSSRARGQPGKEDVERVVSSLKGQFILNNGIVTFPQLSFDVPGASVQLRGTYNLSGEQIDFHGTVRMRAKISQTTTGIKSFFLKIIDPLFKRKGAGAVIPIKITGTREQPSFGIDIRRVFSKSP